MAMLKKRELEQINEAQIESKLVELNKELMKLNAQRAVGTAIENPGKIKELRRSIARLHTVKVARSKKLAGGKKKA
ncbi:MAG: 50S ribosomal protein L29 [Candidatus Woesearchaeota archaeon]